MNTTEKIEEYYNHLKQGGKSENTAIAYKSNVARFFIESGETIETASSQSVNNWLYGVVKNKSSQTANLRRCALVSFFKFCGKIINIEFKTQAVNRGYGHAIPTKKNVMYMIQKARSTPGFRGIRNATIISMLYYTGMRIDEIVRLKVSDINLEKGFLFIRRSKNGSSRKICLSKSLKNDIQTYLTARGKAQSQSPVLFITAGKNHKGTALSYGAMRGIVKKTMTDAGFGHLSPYCFRHLFATQMVHAGAPLSSISKIMGHINAASIFDYIVPKDAPIEEIMEYL